MATILIYIVQIHKLRLGLQVYGLDRANPRMALIPNGHLVGMTIAHEVGHALGVPHSRCGVMQAKLGVNDVVDLRRARLTFTPQEAAVMRQALVMK